MTTLSLPVAFLAGLVSFLLPCVLPLIPGFLAYLAGIPMRNAASHRRTIFLNSIAFVLGFAVVFAALGVLLNTLFANIADSLQVWLARAGGIIIIFFGLYLTRLVKIPSLEREYKMGVATKSNRPMYLTSFLFGFAFAAGWTPCVGVVLGAILGLAASAPGSSFFLFLAYALGLGIPFLLVGFFTAQASAFIGRYARFSEYITIAFGILLIALGILVFTKNLNLIANFNLLNSALLK